MRIEKVTLKYERKFNLGDFNSLSLDVMPTVILDEDDDLDDVMREAWEWCRTNIKHAAAPIVKGTSEVTTQTLFLGLPLELTERKEITQHADNRTD